MFVMNRSPLPRQSRPKPLNLALPAEVHASPGGRPLEVLLRGHWRKVNAIIESWKLDEGWWRDRAISRRYFRLELNDEFEMVLFQDLLSRDWWMQRD